MNLKFVAVAALTVVGAGWVFFGISKSMVTAPPQLAAMTIVRSPTLTADLGGKLATIPRDYLGYLTMDKESAPDQPKILSFGYDFRIDDSAVKTFDLYDDWIAAQKGLSYSTWILVGIGAGSHCIGCTVETLSKMLARQISPNRVGNRAFKYEKAVGDTYGLQAYVSNPISVKNVTGSVSYADTIYYTIDAAGRVNRIIECMNEPYLNVTCNHRLTLASDHKVSVSITYKKKQLARWAEFENAVVTQVEGFYH